MVQGVSSEEANVKTGKKEINVLFAQWCSKSLNDIPSSSIENTMRDLGMYMQVRFDCPRPILRV